MEAPDRPRAGAPRDLRLVRGALRPHRERQPAARGARLLTGAPAARAESRLDDPGLGPTTRRRIERKQALRSWYLECYTKYAECLERCPVEGAALEVGSGSGFLKRELPEVTTSDVLPYPGVDLVLDATRLPYRDASLRAIFMLNTFHHIPDVAGFLSEAQRCLRRGGRVFLVDQHPGWIGAPIYRFLHREGYDSAARDWSFASSGPVSGANGALTWIVFQRDRALFERRYPGLRLEAYRPHTPLRYFASGGLRAWSLLPGWAFDAATRLDARLTRVSSELACFVDVELVRE